MPTPASGYVDQRGRIATLKAGAGVAGVLILLGDTPWAPASLAAHLLSGIGQCVVVAAMLGRLWATLYIGGRKNLCLVTAGPYSVSRNPLYLFSILGAAGAGLAFGSIGAAMLLGALSWVTLHRVARREAESLHRSFGAAYVAYAQDVPMIWPRLLCFDKGHETRFDPVALGRTLRDSLLFLLTLPSAELVAYAKGAGLLPTLIPFF